MLRRAAHRERAHSLQPGRDEAAGVFGEHGEQPGQVGAVPVAGHVGLAEPDQAGVAEAAEELPGPVQDHDRCGRRGCSAQAFCGARASCGARAEELPVREPDCYRQCRHGSGEQGSGYGRAEPGA